MCVTTLNEAETGVAMRSRDRAAAARDADFAEYLAARRQRFLRTAYLVCGDPHTAEDLVQNAMAKLYLAWDKVSGVEHKDAYVRRMIVNEHISWWRRSSRRPEVSSERLPEAGRDDAYDDGTSAQLWAFVQSLPRKQRAVVVLRFYEELSEAETADALGISVGTVKSQASRALAALRQRTPESLDPRSHDPREEER